MKINLNIRKRGEVVAYGKSWHGTITSRNIIPRLKAEFEVLYYDDITKEQLEEKKAYAREAVHNLLNHMAAESDGIDQDQDLGKFDIHNLRIWAQIA